MTSKPHSKAVQAAKADADALGARVQRKAATARENDVEGQREYRRQAKQLRKELRPVAAEGVGGTPHTRRQRSDSGLRAMANAKMLTGEMLTAADEIERVFHAVTLGLRLGAASLEPRSPSERTPMADKLAWAHAKRYRPWADELARDPRRGSAPALAITIAMVVDDMTLAQAEADFRLRRRTVQFWVCRSLTRYAELMSGRDGAVASLERQWSMGSPRIRRMAA